MKIFKDSAIYLFGELFAKALPFLLLPYLTRTLGVAGFGELSYYQTLMALFALLFGLSQDGALTRYFYFYGKRNAHNLMLTGYAYTLIFMGLFLIWAWWQQSLILASAIIAAATQTILGTQLAWRQCQKHALSYVAIQTANGVLVCLLTILILEMTSNQMVTMRFLAMILGNVAVSLVAYFWLAKARKPRFTWQRFRLSGCYILAFGAPLLLHHASGFVKGQLDRIVIYQHYSAEELGIYAASLQISSILSILLMAINKATVPHFYHALKQGSLNAHKVRRLALTGLLISPTFAFIAYMLPEKWFVWFLGSHYVGTHYYIYLFLLGFGLTIPYFILVNFLFYHGKNKLISQISLASAVLYLVALWGLMPLGLAYLPYAIIAGNTAILPILYHFVRD